MQPSNWQWFICCVVHVFRALHTNEYWMKNRFILHLVWANILMDCFHIHHSHNHSSPLSLVTEENYEYNHFDHFQLSEFLIGVIYHIFTCDGIDVCVCAIYHTKSPKILISRVLNWKYRFIRKYAFVSKIFPTGFEGVPFQFSVMLHVPFRVLWYCWPLIRLPKFQVAIKFNNLTERFHSNNWFFSKQGYFVLCKAEK